MKLLFAVISYQGDAQNGNNQLIRETWGKDVEGDLRFFIGRRGLAFVPQIDEVLVDWQKGRPCGHEWWDPKENCCIDFWQYEVREVLKWSVEQGYDFVYLCQTDTFLIPKRLMASGFEQYDIPAISYLKPYPLEQCLSMTFINIDCIRGSTKAQVLCYLVKQSK